MEIKYFENFYLPILSAVKELDDNVYLSKLTINVTEEMNIYVCVAINLYGFSHRNFTIVAKKQQHSIENEIFQDSEEENAEIVFASEEKSFEFLFFIPLVFLFIVFVQIFAILYLLIYRGMIKKSNKNTFI